MRRCALRQPYRYLPRNLPDATHQNSLTFIRLRIDQARDDYRCQRPEVQTVFARCKLAPAKTYQPAPKFVTHTGLNGHT